mgnify:FL=1
MCGIFGYAKRQNAQSNGQLDKLKDVLTYLADESVVRGTDSTGISMINPSSRETFKATASSSEVINDATWKANILNRVTKDNTIAIGHVRYATHGEVNTRNAHPFEIGNVVGAHNGIIYNYNKLAEKYDKTIKVDSEIIFESLNINDDKKALEELEGDFAISWVRDSNKILHLARESSRPLCVAYWKKAKILIWASTDEILEKAFKRAGLSLKNVSLKSEIIYSFDTDKFDNKYNPIKLEFDAKEKTNVKTFTSSHYTDFSYASYYDNSYVGGSGYIDDTKYDDDKSLESKHECNMCYGKFRSDEIIDIETNCSLCYECADDIEECGWCGDYIMIGEGSTFNKWRVCDTCKPGAASNLLLTDNCSIEKTRESTI